MTNVKVCRERVHNKQTDGKYLKKKIGRGGGGGVYDEIRLTNTKQKAGKISPSPSGREEHKSSLHIRAAKPSTEVKHMETRRD